MDRHHTHNGSVFEFGPFRFEPDTGLLCGEADEICLPPRVADVLAYLLSKPGAVIAKEELLDTVWADVLVSDQSLVQAISALRQALGDDAERPRFIQTLPRRGYRFIASVREVASRAQFAPVGGGAARPARAASGGPRMIALSGLGILAVAAALLLGWAVGRTTAAESPPATPWPGIPSRAVHMPGAVSDPSLAHDARSMVFVMQDGANADIYWQRLPEGRPINLTPDIPGQDVHPALSPDGSRIAFRSDRDGGGIFVMGATGEDVRRIVESGTAPAWAPDGDSLVFHSLESGEHSTVMVVDVETGATRSLAQGWFPSWSPGGSRVAFVAAEPDRMITSVRPDGSDPVGIPLPGLVPLEVAWAGDGRTLYFIAHAQFRTTMWRIPVDESSGRALGTAEPIIAGEPSYRDSLSVARDNKTLAYAATDYRSVIQRIPFDAGRLETHGTPRTVVNEDVTAAQFQPSPDDEWLAVSAVEPESDILLIGTSGERRKYLVRGPFVDWSPFWSPDGSRLAFQSDRQGNEGIWLIDTDGKGLRRLTPGDQTIRIRPVWSPDGSAVIFTEGALVPRPSIVKLAGSDGGYEARRLPTPDDRRTGFTATSWSPDGTRVLGERSVAGSRSGILMLDLDSAAYVELSSAGAEPSWLPDGRHLLYSRDGVIIALDSVDGTHTPVLDTGAPYTVARPSADGRSLYVMLLTAESNIFLVDLDR